MAEERRERLPAQIQNNLYLVAWFFDILRLFLGGSFFLLGIAVWVISLVTIIGAVVGTPLGLGLSFLGSVLGAILSLMANGVLWWIYHSHKITLVDRAGSKLFTSIGFTALAFIPLIPWTVISVWTTVRAVLKEDREYNESQGL